MKLFEPAANGQRPKGHLWWFLVWVAVMLAALYITPNPRGHGSHLQIGLPPCPAVLYTGRPCPSCGMTTSFAATLEGNWELATRAHPIGVPLLVLYTFTAWMNLVGFLSRRRFRYDSKLMNTVYAAFVVVVLSHGTWRFIAQPYGEEFTLWYAMEKANIIRENAPNP